MVASGFFAFGRKCICDGHCFGGISLRYCVGGAYREKKRRIQSCVECGWCWDVGDSRNLFLEGASSFFGVVLGVDGRGCVFS